jgi:hypothetical protein
MSWLNMLLEGKTYLILESYIRRRQWISFHSVRLRDTLEGLGVGTHTRCVTLVILDRWSSACHLMQKSKK